MQKKVYLCIHNLKMIITSLIENTSFQALPVEHGLSLHILLQDGQNILFDMGQSDLFVQNAQRLGIDLSKVDIAVVSHGHYDHGGGLDSFLHLNSHAPVYIHKDAFLPHYSLREDGLTYIGLNAQLSTHPRLILCDATTRINSHLMLFAHVQGDCCYPHGNRLLFGPQTSENDTFCHEQNLLIQEGDTSVLIAGCAHRGIVNILRRATDLIGHAPTHVLTGMHLMKSGLNPTDEANFIRLLAAELMRYTGTKFFTMHCTGTEQFEMLKSLMTSQIDYLSCGDQLEIS